nr:uncharacterized protein LOC129388307 [Dermacentor andersoni]
MPLLTMLLLILLPSSILAESGSPCKQKECPLRIIDGWEFFRRHISFYLFARTYKVPGALNDSICVQSPPWVTVNTEKHELQRTFTYRNLSSTHKLHDDHAGEITIWPMAKYFMQFYERNTSQKQSSVEKEKYYYANSTTIMTAYGYALEPPNWEFLYTSEICAVISVRPKAFISTDQPHGSSNQRKPHCELWLTQMIQGYEKSEKGLADACTASFTRLCDISQVQILYFRKLCSRQQ